MDPVKSGGNWYVYCANNPLKFVDPNGLEVHVFSMPVVGAHRHLFIGIKSTDNGVTTRGFYPTDVVAVILASIFNLDDTVGTEMRKDDPREHNIVEEFFENGQEVDGGKHEGEITPPDGMTEAEFDKAVMLLAELYFFITGREFDYNALLGPNSNTAADDIIESAGGIVPDVEGATQQNWGEAPSGLYSDSHSYSECATYYSRG